MKTLRHISFILAFLAATLLHASPPAFLNELATEETSPNSDWVEIYVASDSANLAGFLLYEQGSSVKTFPSANFTYSSGTFILIHFNSSLPDETTLTGDANENGSVDLYTADSGLTGTSNVVTLRNPRGLIVDAVVYSDSASWTSAQQSAFNVAVASGQWVGTTEGGASRNIPQAVNVPGGIGEGNSIARIALFDESNSKGDWIFFRARQTPGMPNLKQSNCSSDSLPPIHITEAAPSISAALGGDFIELYAEIAGNLCGAKIYEGETLVKEFPSVTVNSGAFGPYVIFHAGLKASETMADESDQSGDLNGNGAIDLYSDESSPGLAGTSDNTISLISGMGAVLDFLSFSDDAPFFAESLQNAYDRAVSEGAWSPACRKNDMDCFAAGSVLWGNSGVKSIARKISPEGGPQISAPGSASDWEVGPQSPGKGYGIARLTGNSSLQIFHSPFSPYGDGAYREALLSFAADAGSRFTLQVFNIQGKLVASMMENSEVKEGGLQVVSWDGRDSSGGILPMGIYIVYLEVRQARGDLRREVKTAVIGRQL